MRTAFPSLNVDRHLLDFPSTPSQSTDPMSLVLFGIRSCETCRKARGWLDQRGIQYRYHDLRLDGLPPKALQGWVKRAGWEAVLNKRSLTWRKIPDVDRQIGDSAAAMALMQEYPTLIKRPILCHGRGILIGFDEEEYGRHFRDS
jgi:arsenate reductase